MSEHLPDDVITGAFHRVGTVSSDVDDTVLDDIKSGSQEVTYIGDAHDGFQIENDWEEASVNPASGAITFTTRTHRSQTMTTNHFATPSLTWLEDAAFVDTSTGELTEQATVGAVVLESYDTDPNETDAEAVETFVLVNAELTVEGYDYGETDAGTSELTINVRGPKYAMSYRDDSSV